MNINNRIWRSDRCHWWRAAIQPRDHNCPLWFTNFARIMHAPMVMACITEPMGKQVWTHLSRIAFPVTVKWCNREKWTHCHMSCGRCCYQADTAMEYQDPSITHHTLGNQASYYLLPSQVWMIFTSLNEICHLRKASDKQYKIKQLIKANGYTLPKTSDATSATRD